MGRNKAVDAWFARYENPMKAVVERVRALVLAADPRIDECIKWQAPTFVYKGNLASFFPRSTRHASLMFHAGGRIPGTHALLEGSGSTSRVMKLGSVAEADAARAGIATIVRAWCDLRDSEEAASTASKPRRSGAVKKPATKAPAAKHPATKAPAAKKPAAKRPAARRRDQAG